MKFMLLFMIGIIFCTVFIVGCGEYTPEEIIVNEPLVINTNVSEDFNVTEGRLVDMINTTNNS